MPPARPLLAALPLALVALAAGACDRGDDPAAAGPELRYRASVPLHAPLPVGYRTEVLLDGLAQPTSLAALPDGRLLVAEQTSGRVRIVRDGVLLDEPWVEGLPLYWDEEEFAQELGLAAVAADPRFAENRYVYLYYSAVDEDGSRATVLVRYRDEDGRAADPRELLRVELAPQRQHLGGGIAFDGEYLLVGVGDHQDRNLAQDPASAAGKVLRIDRDGAAAPDSPFVDDPAYDPRVYALGVRNPFGIAVDAATGDVYFTDNRETAGDAVYRLSPGENYGWPQEPLVLVEPLVAYVEPMGLAAAVFYRGDALPAFDGTLLYCSHHGGGRLHWSDVSPGLDGFDLARRDRVIAGACSSGITVAADGFVYYVDYASGLLMRISR